MSDDGNTTGDRREARRALFVVAAAAVAAAASLLDPGRPEGTVQLAYLDPGAGSLLLQGLIAAFAGAAVALKIYWNKVKRLLGMRVVEAEDGEADPKAAADE